MVLFMLMGIGLILLGAAISYFLNPAGMGIDGIIIALLIWIVMALISYYRGAKILIGRDDQEFFSRATLQGLKLYVLPEAVYWYRISEVRMRKNQFSMFAGMQRVGNPFLEIPDLPVEYANLLRYTQGLAAVRLGVVGNTINQVAQSSALRRIVYRFPFIYRLLKGIHRKFA